MSEETAIERLDYSKPPPGYTNPEATNQGWIVWHGEPRPICRTERDEALSAAWAHHKARRDPPGMWVMLHESGCWAWGTADTGQQGLMDEEADVADARAAAWAWHDRRHALASLVEQVAEADGMFAAGIATLNLWPRALAISDSECDDTEAWAEQRGPLPSWLVDSTAEMPEVLRG